MVNQPHISTVTGNHIDEAQKETTLFLQSNPHIIEMLNDLKSIGNFSLPQGAPFDIGSLTKMGFHPFNEAATEIDLAVFFIQSGMYKTFYHHLRSFFELYIVAIYFLSPTCTKENAREWLNGDRDTPFFRKMLKNYLSRTAIHKCTK